MWRRFRRDKAALVSLGFIIILVLAAFGGGPLAAEAAVTLVLPLLAGLTAVHQAGIVQYRQRISASSRSRPLQLAIQSSVALHRRRVGLDCREPDRIDKSHAARRRVARRVQTTLVNTTRRHTQKSARRWVN